MARTRAERKAARIGAVGPTGRQALQAGPNEGTSKAFLMDALAGQGGRLMPMVGLQEALAGRLVADEGRAPARGAHAGAPET